MVVRRMRSLVYRQPPCLIEVVDPPDEAPFGIAPSAKVLNVQVADGKHVGRFRGRRTGIAPGLRRVYCRCDFSAPPFLSDFCAKTIERNSLFPTPARVSGCPKAQQFGGIQAVREGARSGRANGSTLEEWPACGAWAASRPPNC